MYGDINEHQNDSEYMMSNVIICPHNRNVRKLNQKIADTLRTTECISYSADKGIDQRVDIQGKKF